MKQPLEQLKEGIIPERYELGKLAFALVTQFGIRRGDCKYKTISYSRVDITFNIVSHDTYVFVDVLPTGRFTGGAKAEPDPQVWGHFVRPSDARVREALTLLKQHAVLDRLALGF